MPLTERIAKPGLYDLTGDEYHDDCCVEPSVSKSGLAVLINHSPAKFYAMAPFNPNAVERPPKSVFSVGQAVHELILQGEQEFYARNLPLPEDVIKSKKLKEKAAKDGYRLLSHKEHETIKAMHRAFEAHPLASVPFRQGLPERSLVWQDPETGIWLKARPDFLPDRIGSIPEYKSTRLATRAAFKRDAFAYDYYLQAALYLQGIKAVLGETPDDFVFVYQEKEPPYCIRLFSLHDDWYDEAQKLLRAAIHLFAECLERDHWPDYGEDVEQVEMPSRVHWHVEDMVAQRNRAFQEVAA